MPSDANLILLTNGQYENLACALPLVLSATDPECRIVCHPDVAAQLRSTRMIQESKLLVLQMGGCVDLGYVRLTNVLKSFKQQNENKRRVSGAASSMIDI